MKYFLLWLIQNFYCIILTSLSFQCWHLLTAFSFKVKVRFPRFLYDEWILDIWTLCSETLDFIHPSVLTGSLWNGSSKWRESPISWLSGLGRNLASFPSINTCERLLLLLGKLEIPAYHLRICWYPQLGRSRSGYCPLHNPHWWGFIIIGHW